MWRLACVSATVALAAVPAAQAQSGATVTARAGRSELSFGRSTTVFGTLTAASVPVAGQPVELEASPYPFGGWRKVAAALTAQDGSYAFPVAPDRNTRYRVDSSAPQAQSGTVEIVVDELLRARLRYLPLGRVRLSVSSRHPPDLRWGGRRAYWFVAEGARRRFVLAALGPARRSAAT